MKSLVVLILFLSQAAHSQTESGTVFVVIQDQGKITIAADSRTTRGAGGYDDASCKILAVGSKFVFVMAGLASIDGNRWDSSSAARDIWEQESKTVSSNPIPIVQRVSDNWIKAAELAYTSPDVIGDVRKHTDKVPVVASAFFAAIDQSGKLQTRAVNIHFDLELFDTSRKVKLSHKVLEPGKTSTFFGGFGEIATEFNNRSTPRAKDYMRWFEARTAGLSSDQWEAELTSKLVELSILLHPRNNELAFPIDVLQLQEGAGVHWVWRKPNCAAN